jgi:CBS-domain-containing membrane protein
MTVRPETSVEEATALMQQCRVGRLPVVDQGYRLIGMVTLGSLALRSGEADEAFGTAQETSVARYLGSRVHHQRSPAPIRRTPNARRQRNERTREPGRTEAPGAYLGAA